MRIALYQPDIPQNTGNIFRLGACLGVPVDVIEPTGFIFDESDHRSLTAIILKANHYYTDKKDVWNQLIINAMKQDYSWEISAIEYVDLYEQALIF